MRGLTTKLAVSSALLLTAFLAVGCGSKRRVRAPVAPYLGPETGLASWYGDPYHGRRAANGEIYDMEQMTAAHRTLEFGTWVKVINLENGKSAVVRITDRGPFVDGRIIDLSRAAAREIAMLGPGTARVRLEITTRPQYAPEEKYALQVGAFQDRDRAERVRREMEARHRPARLLVRQGDPVLWRVLVGEEDSVKQAMAIAGKLGLDEDQAFVVRLDSLPPNEAGTTP
jgi:rare lipoprotein A